MCGIAGLVGDNEAAFKTWLMLLALQHRGQNGSGLAVRNGQDIQVERRPGLASAFRDFDFADRLPGTAAIGQNRYPITGKDKDVNRQPFLRRSSRLGQIAVVHNGNLTNNFRIRRQLETLGVIFEAETDTELIPVLYGMSSCNNPIDRLIEVCGLLEGSFSVIGMTEVGFFALRDPHGIRPLHMGQHPNGAWVFASETRAFDVLTEDQPFRQVAEVPPGQIVFVTSDGTIEQHRFAADAPQRFCSFEGVYIAKEDSSAPRHAEPPITGKTYRAIREEAGHRLANRIKESGIAPDVVIGVPSTGSVIARACAEALGVPYAEGLVRNDSIQRTFIEDDPRYRELALRLKLNPNRDVCDGAKVFVVDDSLVRGGTSRILIQMVRRAGAVRVDIGFGCPPIINPCFWAGLATREREQLLAAVHPIDALPRVLGADSVTFLTLPDHLQAQGDPKGTHTCFACFDPERRRPVPHHVLDFPGYED